MLPWNIQSVLQFLLHKIVGAGMVQWKSQSVSCRQMYVLRENFVLNAEEFSPVSSPSFFFLLSLSLGRQERNGAEGKVTPKLKVRHP